MSQPFRFETRVRFVDTDTSGRIHYTAMFRYFEAAETEFFRTINLAHTRRAFDFPRVHVECDFRIPLGYDDPIQVEVCLTKLGTSSLRLEFRTFKNAELAAKGAIVMACVDRETQRAMPIPDTIRASLETVLVPAVA